MQVAFKMWRLGRWHFVKAKLEHLVYLKKKKTPETHEKYNTECGSNI